MVEKVGLGSLLGWDFQPFSETGGPGCVRYGDNGILQEV